MKTKLSILISMLFPIFLFAQDDREWRKYTRKHFEYIEWNGKQYQNDPRGVRFILQDLEAVNPTLHKILAADAKKNNKKAKNRIVISTISLLGGAMSFIFALLSEVESIGNNTNNQNKGDNFYLLGFGSTCLGAAAIVSVRENDRKFIYNFTQKLNQNSPDRAAKFTIRPEVQLGNYASVGLAFTLHF